MPPCFQLRYFVYIFRAFSLLVALQFNSTAHANYADYFFKEQGPFWNFDIYITWEHDVSSSTGIYPAFTFGFQNGQGGYMGTQSDSNGKHALFSIWDESDDSITALPASTNCNRFGHEGSGTSCFMDYPWIAGREYLLRIWVLNSDNDGQFWGGWIKDTVTQQETNIGVIYLRNSKGYLGYGLLTRSSVFLERYVSDPAGGCTSQPAAKLVWRGPYANNNGATANRALVSFAHYPTSCTNNNVWSTGYPFVSAEDGGATQRTTPEYTDVWAIPLSVIISGDGSGQVNGDMACFSGTSCPSKEFLLGTTVMLVATPQTNSLFDGWSGACYGFGNCSLYMDSAKSVTAVFSAGIPVKVMESNKTYKLLQNAYNEASTVSGNTIMVRSVSLDENLNLNRPIGVTIRGGYDATFQTNSDQSAVKGVVVIRAGSLTADDLIVW
jgi:hypothetical protein